MTESENIGLEDLENIPVGGLTPEEMDKYDGTRAKIERGEVIDDEIPFGEDGKQLPEGETRSVKKVVFYTEPVGTDVLGNPIVVRENLNLKHNAATNKWGPSQHEKSNTFKFMKRYSLNHLNEAIGKEIVIRVKTTSKGNKFLGISY